MIFTLFEYQSQTISYANSTPEFSWIGPPSKIKCFTQKLDWYNHKSRVTKAFEQFFLNLVFACTVHDAALKADISYDMGRTIIQRAIPTNIDWKKCDDIQVVGLDEISLKKGHKQYVTIVSIKDNNGQVNILTVLPDRKKETVKSFLKTIPIEIKKQIIEVACDMYDGFISAVEEELSDTRIVIDRFHVTTNYSKSFDSLRKDEMKRIKKILPKEEYKKLKGVMWSLRKNPKNITKKEKKQLQLLFSYSKLLKDGYELKLKLKNYLDEDVGLVRGKLRFDHWIKTVCSKGITCFNSFIETFKRYEDYILNYYENRTTGGFIEGLNNKIKVIKRRCYGITNVENLFRRIWLDLTGYRRPVKFYT